MPPRWGEAEAPSQWGEAEGGGPAAARRFPPAARLAPQRGTHPAERDPGVTKAEAAEEAEVGPGTVRVLEAEVEPGTAKVLKAEVEHGTVKVLEAEAKPGTEKVRVSKPGGGLTTWAVASVACCATDMACALRRRS